MLFSIFNFFNSESFVFEGFSRKNLISHFQMLIRMRSRYRRRPFPTSPKPFGGARPKVRIFVLKLFLVSNFKSPIIILNFCPYSETLNLNKCVLGTFWRSHSVENHQNAFSGNYCSTLFFCVNVMCLTLRQLFTF